jgi:hypothetical protein
VAHTRLHVGVFGLQNIMGRRYNADVHRAATYGGADSGNTDPNDPAAAELHRGHLPDHHSDIGIGKSVALSRV